MALSATDIFLGYGSLVGFAPETTYGTAVSPTVWLRLISASINRERPQIPRPHLHGGTGRVAHGYTVERDDVSTTLVVEGSFSGIGLLLRLAMGPAPTSTGAGPYAHPFLLGNVLASGTFHIYRGTDAFGTLTERFVKIAGAMVDRLTLRVQTGQVVRLEIELIGQATTYDDQSTPSVTVPSPILYHQVGNISWNSGSYDGNGYELTISNGLTRRRILGSLTTARPVPSTLREVVFRLTRDHCDETLIAGMIAQTESDLTFTITGTGNESLVVEMHSARVTSPDNTSFGEGAFGPIPEVVELRPRNVPGSTDYGLAITLNNDNASYIT